MKMKAANFAVMPIRRHQVVNLILTYHHIFSHLKHKTGSKRQPRQVQTASPASIKLPPELLRKLNNQPNR